MLEIIHLNWYVDSDGKWKINPRETKINGESFIADGIREDNSDRPKAILASDASEWLIPKYGVEIEVEKPKKKRKPKKKKEEAVETIQEEPIEVVEEEKDQLVGENTENLENPE